MNGKHVLCRSTATCLDELRLVSWMHMSEDRRSMERRVSKSVGSRDVHAYSTSQHGTTLSTHFTNVYTD